MVALGVNAKTQAPEEKYAPALAPAVHDPLFTKPSSVTAAPVLDSEKPNGWLPLAGFVSNGMEM